MNKSKANSTIEIAPEVETSGDCYRGIRKKPFLDLHPKKGVFESTWNRGT